MADDRKASIADLQKQVTAKFDRVRVTDFGGNPKYQTIANAIIRFRLTPMSGALRS